MREIGLQSLALGFGTARSFELSRQHFTRFTFGQGRCRDCCGVYIVIAKVGLDALGITVRAFIAAIADLTGATGLFCVDIGIGGFMRRQWQYAFAATLAALASLMQTSFGLPLSSLHLALAMS